MEKIKHYDPIEALGKLGRKKLKGKSIKKLKEEAKAELEKNANP